MEFAGCWLIHSNSSHVTSDGLGHGHGTAGLRTSANLYGFGCVDFADVKVCTIAEHWPDDFAALYIRAGYGRVDSGTPLHSEVSTAAGLIKRTQSHCDWTQLRLHDRNPVCNVLARVIDQLFDVMLVRVISFG